MPGRDLCFSHDPTLAERRKQGSIQGGRGKSAKVRAQRQLRDAAMEPQDVAGLLSVAMNRVAKGVMEPAIGNALGSMARAYVVIRETSDLAERLDALEAAAGLTPASNVTRIDRRVG